MISKHFLGVDFFIQVDASAEHSLADVSHDWLSVALH